MFSLNLIIFSYYHRQNIKNGLVLPPNWCVASYQLSYVYHHKYWALQTGLSCQEKKETQVTSQGNQTWNDGKVFIKPDIFDNHFIAYWNAIYKLVTNISLCN